MYQRRFKVSALAGTTATLVPADGEQTKGDFADTISNIVVTFANARDAQIFDIVNRGFLVSIQKA